MRHALVTIVWIAGFSAIAAGGQMRRSGVPTELSPKVQDVTSDRIERLRQWLKAVDRHEPGVEDDEVITVGVWSNAQLRSLWIDVNVLSQLMRNVRLSRFMIRMESQRNATEIRFSSTQLRQMATLACAAGARLARPDCVSIKAASSVDEELLRLAEHAGAERERSGDDNYVVRRGALLHADVAMLQPRGAVEPFASPFAAPPVGPQTWRIDIADGRSLDAGLSAVHWDIARLALDQVRPPGFEKPAPERDVMVRAFYRATAAWMQFREDHDTIHLDRGRAIFPDDADLLFLSGCQRETYAAPAIQAATRAVSLPPGMTIAIESERAELRQAETFFRRALAKQADMAEAHLRLGRVLGLEGHHTEAAAELRQVLTSLPDDPLRYYGELFLGAEEEALGHFDAARDGFERAAALFPSAQSPLIALSELAKRRGDRAGALAAIDRLFKLPPAGHEERDDPWWSYHVAQARDADALLEALRARFGRAPQQ